MITLPMFQKLCKYVENNEKHNHISRGKNTLDEINNKGKDEYLETWPQKLQNKHTEEKGINQNLNKVLMSCRAITNSQINTHAIKSTQGKKRMGLKILKEICLEIFQI